MSEVSEYLADARVDIADSIDDNLVCLKVGGMNWGTLSNFSAVIGKAKAKKSFLVMLALAAGVKQSLEHITVQFAGDNNKIIYFDTEQSKGHILRSVQRIASLSGVHPRNLETYGLRRYTPAMRLAMIEEAIYDSEDCGLVVIDGIRDLVTSINDEEQATMITSKLLKWTEEKNIHIIIVLHQNKGDNNARGHVGSEIINKAETVLSVTRDLYNKDISFVASEYAREKEFEPFAFTISAEGLPIILKDYNPKDIKNSTISIETHINVLNQVFAFAPTPRYREFVGNLRVFFDKAGIKVGENKVKNYITYYLSEKFVSKDDTTGGYPIYKLNPPSLYLGYA